MTTQRPADARTELRRGPETQHEAEMWGSAPWERIEHLPAPTHARILLVLSVGPSVRSLDLGNRDRRRFALLAALAGAHLTGLATPPRLIQTTCRPARAEGLHIRFDVGDAQPLGEKAAADTRRKTVLPTYGRRRGNDPLDRGRVTTFKRHSGTRSAFASKRATHRSPGPRGHEIRQLAVSV
jgi:hypothetical protein